MKFKLFSLFLALAVLISLAGVATPAKAVGYGTAFLTSITYMNVGTTDAIVSMDFYAEGASTPTNYPVANLAKGAAASLSVSAVFPNAFKGSAIISSSQPLVATMVQVPQGSTSVKNRPMSNGFGAGATSVLIPTVLKAMFNSNSIFSVQNAGSSAAAVTVQFIHSTNGNDFADTSISALAPGAAKYFDMGTYNSAGSPFNGSVRVTSTNGQPLVVTDLELSTSGDAVYSFEGVPSGATTLFMPSAMCKFGPPASSSFYAIMNTSSSASTGVSVHYTGAVGSTPVDRTFDLGSLAPGAKISTNGCGPASELPAGFIGAAVVTSTSQPVVAIAKIVGAGAFQTAHLGASTGAQKLAAPYVRYSDKFYSYTNSTPVQQTNIAVQNIGGGTIAAGTITVQFVGADGSVKGTYTYPNALASGAKFSVNPKTAGVAEFGYVAGSNGLPTSYGGGALVSGPSGAQLAAMVRVQSSTAQGDVAEDYNASVAP